jgi:hypothetical protein
MALLILVPLILAACGGNDDEPEEVVCVEPVDESTLPEEYESDTEASFPSGTTYNYPAGWDLTEISENIHELSDPAAPAVILRIVDTPALEETGLEGQPWRTEDYLDAYAEHFYANVAYERTSFGSGTVLGRQVADGRLTLPCDGEATIRMVSNPSGDHMIVDLRSEQGPIPDASNGVRGDVWIAVSR